MSRNRDEKPFQLASNGEGNGTSAAERVEYLENVGVQISGTFDATVAIEGRMSASLNYDELATFTGPVIYPIPNDMPLHQIRITVTNYVSGAIAAVVVGRTARR